jgi:hypothetical protein
MRRDGQGHASMMRSISLLRLTEVAVLTALLTTPSQVVAQGPLYNTPRVDVIPFRIDPTQQVIVLPPPASTVDDASRKFDARAASAIFQASGGNLFTLSGQDYGVALLASYARADYIDDGLGQQLRAQADKSLLLRTAGKIGSVGDGDYDMVLNLYIAALYKYYNVMSDKAREHVIANLLTVRGPLGRHESECENCSSVATIPETENHLFTIETARYLTNQLLYQRTHLVQFDNRRNGGGRDGNDPQATAVWLLDQLRSRLLHDFDEYNARPYQDQIMMAMLNLATYAYDDDVRLEARMVLDYISAKVAVSSNGLRRVPPFRRRNEDDRWGPRIKDGLALRSPLLGAQQFTDDPLLDKNGEHLEYVPDPQGPWYAQLAGNTGMLGGSVRGTPGAGNFGLGMVVAGLHDYRVPNLVVDLFVNVSNRWYQRLRHRHTNRDFGDEEMVDEIYAGSPSYLITAGGRPANKVYQGSAAGVFSGKTSDFGSAMPTTFMPTGVGATLEEMIQFGHYADGLAEGADLIAHLCVAPDFACGANVFPTAALRDASPNDASVVKVGPWIFVDRGHDGERRAGYYLALYDGSALFGEAFGLLEAHDTLLHPGLSFRDFKERVLSEHGATRFLVEGTNSYVTQSGQEIRFTIGRRNVVLSSSSVVARSGHFAFGDVINSDQESGVVTISSPAQPGKIVLDVRDRFRPVRTSESGVVTRAGFDVHAEVWVDFNSPIPSDVNGDFYRPLTTLSEAQRLVMEGGTIKIVPGATRESIVLNRRMQLTSFAGAAVVSVR